LEVSGSLTSPKSTKLLEEDSLNEVWLIELIVAFFTPEDGFSWGFFWVAEYLTGWTFVYLDLRA
jgi:hypothetical protein